MGGEDLRGSVSMVADRYRLEGRVGRGGMADVHSAHDTVLDRRVAIKLLRDTPDSETARARFVSEARILAGLSHPGLVTVLDAGISGDRPYLVMELLPGDTVADLVERGSQPLERVAQIGAQVAEALVPVHAAGVVHRDIKPSNLLIDAWARVRLTDFGIARLVGDAAHVTRTGTTVGTMTYLAPEQASGGEVGTAADVYSLGLVLLELITGVPAFTGTATEAALARLTCDPVVPAHLPAPLRDLLTEMTAREPATRPTAAETAARLATSSRTAAAARAAQAGIDTRPALPLVPTPSRAPLGWRGRRARTAALAGVAALVAAGLGVWLADAGVRADAGAVRWPTAAPTPAVVAAPSPDAGAVAVRPVADPAGPAGPAHSGKHHPKRHKPRHHRHHHKKPRHHEAKHHGHRHHKPHHKHHH